MDNITELKSHIRDLADRCYRKNIYTFTGFLNLSEQSEVLAMERELSFVEHSFFGGCEGCERKVLRFGSISLLGYEDEFPIKCLVIEPVNEKFSDDLTHRDFLGAVMNLGISREMIGDIVIRDKHAYVFCIDKMADFIVSELTRVKHTTVSCYAAEECPAQARPAFAEMNLIVSSARCDCVVAGLYKLSRSTSSDLFKERCIFINGRQCESAGTVLNELDTVSVRGFGKFIFDGIEKDTRKGRLRISLRKYI